MRARLASWSLLFAACGSTSPPAELAPTPVTEPPAPVAAASPPSCRVEAVRAEGLVVTPSEGEPFAVAVSDGALVFAPTRDELALAAEVEHPLRFSARAPVGEQRLALTRPATLAAGAIHAVPGLAVVGLAHTERGLSARLVLGRASPAHRDGVELVAGHVSVACADLGAETDAALEVRPSILRRVAGGELQVATMHPLVVRPVRAAPATIELAPARASGFVPVWVLDRQGSDVRVVIAFSDGSRVEGWVARAVLREPSAREAEIVDALTSAPEPEPIAFGLLGTTQDTSAGPIADGYVGPGALRPSSPVAIAPGGATWATSAEQPLEVRVRWQRGATHAQLLEVPGMWIRSERSWVERGDLSLPEGL